MSLSIRSKFILVSVSITLLALMLFTSVIHKRVAKYKYQQNVKTNHILAEQIFQRVKGVQDLNKIRRLLNKKNQPAQMYALLDKNNEILVAEKNKNEKTLLNNILFEIKKKNIEGRIKNNVSNYFWVLKDAPNSKNKLLLVYPFSPSTLSEFNNFFGLPFIISGLILCWIMVWTSIILSSLVVKLQNQKQALSEQAIDIEKSRDQAMYANQTKSNFLANMSHEIRTPLTSIIGFAESGLDVEQSKTERINATNIIIKSGKHLLNIINEILDLSKIETGKLNVEQIPTSIIEIVEEINQIISVMAKEKGLFFEIKYTYPLPENFISDPLRIKQILLNLCSNAIKFTKHGKVSLNVSFSSEFSNLKIEVVDTGIGMIDEQIEKIFKPFEQADSSTTRKYGGTGLGLTLSKQLIEILNGTITVASTIDKGSIFTVIFKDIGVDNYISNPSGNDSIEKDSKLYGIPKLTGSVLLAEDNVDIQDLVKLLVKKVGIEIDVVENGEQAIEATLKAEYDLILLDIQMPVMDGLTAMKILSEQGYKRPVCAMTANAMQEDRDECKAAGFSGFISKPINRNDLYTLLSKYLIAAEIDERDNVTLTSELLEDEPELIDLVDKFILRLPEYRDKINEAHFDNDDEKLKNIIHKMKGVGGNYGYLSLTDLCAKVEFEIKSKNTEEVTSLIDEFNLLTEEIIQGHNNYHKLVSK